MEVYQAIQPPHLELAGIVDELAIPLAPPCRNPSQVPHSLCEPTRHPREDELSHFFMQARRASAHCFILLPAFFAHLK